MESNFFEDYEVNCKNQRAKNEVLLDEFDAWLRAKGLKESTVRNHQMNIDLYINRYLLYDDVVDPAGGIFNVDGFLGDWFIRKAMWANVAAVRTNAASIKKFYTFMHENGAISKEALQGLKEHIKEDLPEWLETMQRYDDPGIDLDDVFW